MSFGRKYIDLSHSLDAGTVIYPGDPDYYMVAHASHIKDGYSVHKLSLGTHTGTHIDAPYHFFADEDTVEKILIGDLIGPVVVIDLSGLNSQGGLLLEEGKDIQPLNERERITWDYLQPYEHFLLPGRILLINTGWSKLHYKTPKYRDHPYLAPDVASELLTRGIRVVGVDTLNPDETPPSSDAPESADGFGFHEKFLGGGGLIAENVTNLEELIEAQKATPGTTWIVNLVPLKLVGGDGSPVRAFAYNLE
ncbi:putative cyclase [Agrocybe pediades]|nr:putative cyclase [Agrocybe pediades]